MMVSLRKIKLGEEQLTDILVHLELGSGLYCRRLLGKLLCMDDCFTVRMLAEAAGTPRAKTYELFNMFVEAGLVEVLPMHVYPEDWGCYTRAERREYRKRHGLSNRGKEPRRHRFRHCELYRRLDRRLQREIEEIEAEANREKRQVVECFTSVLSPLRDFVDAVEEIEA